jgi:hypothetical protein
MGVRRAVALLGHPAVGAPVLLGGRRPCVLVPPDWEALPAEAQRAGLLHELAHLARGDHRARLGEEVVRVAFFFHPLVRWLLDRLDGERERLCDAAVLGRGVGPRQLAGVLVEFARRLGPGRPTVRCAGALPLLNRVTVKDRIHQLLEDDMNRWTRPVSRRQALALAAGVLGVMIGLGSLGVRAAKLDPPAPPASPPPAAAPAAPQAAPAEAPRGEGGLEAKLVDAAGNPVARATIVGMCRSMQCNPLPGPALRTDKDGRFRLERAPDGPITPGSVVTLQVRTAGGQSYEVNVLVPARGVADVRLPAAAAAGLKLPRKVGPGDLAGVVVGEDGKPLEGVHVHAWDWVPDHQTTTDKDGVFLLENVAQEGKVQVRFRKPGYSPVMFVQQPAGVAGWVVAMDTKTYFEGTVRGPDGKPAPGAQIRADQGPKGARGVVITNIWTDTKADAKGRYRLCVQPDAYEFHVKAPGVGVARLPKQAIGQGQGVQLDIALEPGVTFRAVTVDAETGKPVPGVRLWHWQHKDVEGRSDAKGEVVIGEMLPGSFEFSIEAAGYTRWWSEQAKSEWNRRSIAKPELNWQRNFDDVDYDLRPGMAPVKIELERGVRVRGKVVDPEGKPVAGATVAPALTGSGNSLTGDTRFSVETGADGGFEVLLPASGKARYNLVAHDGKYEEWRKWANGVLPPLRTTPGQEIAGVVLTLSRPAAVRGKVVDARGKPVAGREVRAQAADKRENRYYDPTTTTRADGTFELRFIRPGEQFIQVAPFWLRAEEAPARGTKRLELKAGATVEGVELVAEDEQR